MIRFFNLFVGLRYAGARRRTQLVSFISGISILGLMLGVGLLLTVLSVMNGFEKELRDRILGIMPHGAIYFRYGIEDWPSVRDQLLENPEFIAAAPFVELQGMLSVGKKVQPTALYGIDVGSEQSVSVIADYVAPDVLEKLSAQEGGDNNAIVLGAGLAKNLNAQTGDRLTVLVPNSRNARELPKFKPMYLAGVIESGTELDYALALMNMEAASELSEFPGRVSGLRVKTQDLFSAPDAIYRQVRSMEYGYYGSDWTRTHGNLFHAVQMSKNLVGLLLFLIVAIAAFNVVSTLVMVVVDKQTDIAILKTLGASRGDILAIFVVQGAVIGALGTLLGVGFGVVGSLVAHDVVNALQSLFHVQFLDAEIYPVNYLPSELQLHDFLLVAGVSLLMSLLATLYPAWRASRVAPAEALRFE
ncbi:lipoprotein-releasing ABC transporter permease subunit [Aestuariicella hydrocarbonica]|uniref:Lipoprotein-releasing ABC transporter permease subunit n=1 Tax=Pseudomaricurvus hydrocarbonicus TaxID=1470433 RepID=A0A9E5MPQ4_9GAMM|nr:lipoprotein-releasing ABC transporter permease subunit [Aestuariicella hydrocarbonica]NHO68037.1 lipoprotein-releasing ABC transporter permease subunit [Aestuariicella hydrocarbonica]